MGKCTLSDRITIFAGEASPIHQTSRKTVGQWLPLREGTSLMKQVLAASLQGRFIGSRLKQLLCKAFAGYVQLGHRMVSSIEASQQNMLER